MNNPCDIWFRIFVIVFILISTGTFFVLVLEFIKGVFTKSGNITFDSQQRKIEILEDELNQCKDNN